MCPSNSTDSDVVRTYSPLTSPHGNPPDRRHRQDRSPYSLPPSRCQNSIPPCLSQRQGLSSGMPATKLDWLKSTNFSKPLQHKHPSTSDRFSAVYIVAPRAANPANPMNSFVDYTIKEYSVKRFVLIGDSSSKPGGLHVEKVFCIGALNMRCCVRPGP